MFRNMLSVRDSTGRAAGWFVDGAGRAREWRIRGGAWTTRVFAAAKRYA
jgi:hypothetical protein